MSGQTVFYALLRTALDPMLAVSGPQGIVHLEFLPTAWEYHVRAHAVARRCFSTVSDSELLAQAAQAGGDMPIPSQPSLDLQEEPAAFADLRAQLAEYFTAQRTSFDLPLDLRGTDFQIRVWKDLQNIPYGRLRTYGQVARDLDQPKATRAVGQAAGQNPLPLLVPCHRVVGKDGHLVGFAGGITTKARLLRLEGHTLGDAARIEAPRLF